MDGEKKEGSQNGDSNGALKGENGASGQQVYADDIKEGEAVQEDKPLVCMCFLCLCACI
jgi:hypothetical protein